MQSRGIVLKASSVGWFASRLDHELKKANLLREVVKYRSVRSARLLAQMSLPDYYVAR